MKFLPASEPVEILLWFHSMYVNHQFQFLFLYHNPMPKTLCPMPHALAIDSFPIVLITLCPDSDHSDALDPEPYCKNPRP